MRKIATFALLILGVACSDSDLRRSIFIPDPELHVLPAYSEWGYNTFGAFYDRETFLFDNREVPLKVVHMDEKTSLIFTGKKGDPFGNNSTEFSMTIDIENFKPENYSDLLVLHDSILDLSHSSIRIVFTDGAKLDTAANVEGELNFIRIQHLLVDGQSMQAILSGRFDFNAVVDGVPVAISEGRFDVGVGDHNFYHY